MIPFVAALLLASVQTPADEARMQRIGPHVSACIRGQAAPGELIETCAERLAVQADEAKAREAVQAARRAEEEVVAARLWGEPCDPLDEMTGACPDDRRMASHARACIERRPEDQTLEACVAHREEIGDRYDTWARNAEAARARSATPEPPPDPEPPADRNGCRRERVVSPDGQSVSYAFVCNRTWTR